MFQKQILGNENIKGANKKDASLANFEKDKEVILDHRINEETESEIIERQERIRKIRDLES